MRNLVWFVAFASCAPSAPPGVLTVVGTPNAVVVREGSGAWQTAPAFVDPDGFTRYPLASGRLTIAIVCDTPGIVEYQAFADDELFTRTLDPCGEFGVGANVQGTVTGSAAIAMDDTWRTMDAGGDGSWSFVWEGITPGLHDIAAVGPTGFVILHDVDIGHDPFSQLPAIDMTTATPIGTALVSAPLAASDEQLTLFSELVTARGANVLVSATPDAFPLFPPTIASAGDQQWMVADFGAMPAPGISTGRSLEVAMTGRVPATTDLPPRLDGHVHYQGTEVVVDVVADETDVTFAAGSKSQELTVTSRFRQDNPIAFDLSYPGYDPSWAIDLSQPHMRRVNLIDRSVDVVSVSTLTEQVASP